MSENLGGPGNRQIDNRFASLTTETRLGRSGQVLTSSWFLPQGNWWRIDLIGLYVDNTADIAATALDLSAIYNDSDIFLIRLPTLLPVGVFDGHVTYAVGMPLLDMTAEQYVVLPLPDVYLPPTSEIRLTLTGGSPDLSQGDVTIIYRSAANLLMPPSA